MANSSSVNINFTKNRIDFFSKNESFIDNNFEKIFNILDELSLKIGRVGIVFTYFKEANIEQMKNMFDILEVGRTTKKEWLDTKSGQFYVKFKKSGGK